MRFTRIILLEVRRLCSTHDLKVLLSHTLKPGVREALNTLPYHLLEKNLQISSGYCVRGKGDCKYVGLPIPEKRRDSSTLGINTTYRMRCTKEGMPSEYSMLISLFVVARFWHFQSRRSSSAEFFHSNGYEHRKKRF